MKRLFILATAAIVALASCAKTEVVYTGAPEEITFKTYTDVMTKTLGESAYDNMGVIAYQGDVVYFDATTFEEGTPWTAEAGNERYWPATGDLRFVVYAPADGWTYAETTTPATKTLTATIPVGDEVPDYLYASEQPVGNKTDNAAGVDVDLKHAAAAVVLNFQGEKDVVALTSVTLTGTIQSGTCNVDYTANPPTVVWNTTGAPSVQKEFLKDTDSPVAFSDSKPNQEYTTRVVPVTSQASTIVFNYTLNGSPASYTIDAATLGAWDPGKKYTYTISIGATEIKVNPTVLGYTEETPDIPSIG